MTFFVIIVLACCVHVNGFHPGADFVPYKKVPVGTSSQELKALVLSTKIDQDMFVQKLENTTDVVNKSISDLNAAQMVHVKKVSELALKVTEAISGLQDIRTLTYNASSDMKILKTLIKETTKKNEKSKNEDSETVKTSTQAATPKNKEKAKRNGCPASKHYERLNNNMCIRMSKHRLSWKMSQRKCRDEGGELLTLKTEEEQQLVHEYIAKQLGSSWKVFKSRIGVGLEKETRHAPFKWVIQSNYTGKWYHGHPLKMYGWKCAYLRFEGLSNYLCSIRCRYICQIK